MPSFDGKGQIAAAIYALELLGDATMVTLKAAGALVAIKAPKDFRAELGAPFAARVPIGACHLFDAQTGARLSTGHDTKG
jgi:multiple sugar transport system ATP-binding protein